MDFTNTPRDVPPHRPSPGGPLRPAPQRRVFSDFTPRSNSRPAVPQHPARPAPNPVATTPVTAPHPASQPLRPQSVPAPRPDPAPSTSLQAPSVELSEPDTAKSSAPRLHTKGTHAGLVGFICFLIFGALLLSPLLPGKILENFPGSSETASTGDQTIGCAEDIIGTTTSLAYNTRIGSPIVYNYSSTTTEKGLCGGEQQTAVEGRTSQFNPLGLAADLLLALLVAIGVAQVWHLLFRAKD